MPVIIDTSVIVAAALTTERYHKQCVELFDELRAKNERLLLPPTVTAEAGYLLNQLSGVKQEAKFLRGVADGDLEPIDLLRIDYARMDELVEQYQNLNIGTTDASIIALAERFRIKQIATLNWRDFTVVRPRYVGEFEILPSWPM